MVRACDGYLGSSLHWLVVVIPLTDYTPAHGPLMVSPGKHKATRVLPTTNGRTHPISVAAIPAQSDTPGTRPPMVGGVVGVDLLDPELRRGDMFLFNGFTWHFAAPNQGPATRLGLYMKFRARSAPSSCGPLLFPSAIAAVVPSRLLPYHRRDGTQTIDRAVWILEDGVSHEICMLANGELPGVDLPSTGVMRQNDTGAWDLANVIGACLDHAGLLAGCDLGWLSWVTVIRLLAHIHLSPVRRILTGPHPAHVRTQDHKFNAGEENEQVVRVYGHISEGSLAGQAAQLARSGVRFAPASASATGGAEREWIRCWQESRDVASGVVVRRGFGFPLDRGHEMEGWQSDDGTGPADEAASFLVNADVLKLKGE